MSERIDPAAIQGIVARGYGSLHYSAFLLLGINDVAYARVWLGTLKVTSAADAAEQTAVNLALTYRGLQALGLDAAALEGIGDELREGMVSAHRRRILGDHDQSAPERWDWGGARPEQGLGVGTGAGIAAGLAAGAALPQTPAREGEVEAGGTRQVWGDEIDMLLMLYAEKPEQLQDLIDRAIAEEGKRGVTVFKVIKGSWLEGNKEHFGFADGIAQPGIKGLGRPGRRANAVAAGEVLLGHVNEYGRYPLSPKVAAPTPLLPDAGGGPGRDFGRDGSYLVMRQLEQDVPAFWKWVTEAAARVRVGETLPGDDPRIVLASKMVGRWPSGAPLALCPKR
ncbi:MAG TPA: hypothetical protein VL172_04690, partial [Kofleriaceae bacterium]|nr:hypothetical protein [Kofleriaceae bacterium]